MCGVCGRYPTLVKRLVGTRIVQASCGASHTVLLSLTTSQDRPGGLAPVRAGGNVFVAGPPWALGRPINKFELVETLKKEPVKQISAGYSHTAVVTQQGEVWTWGNNHSGCTGHPVNRHFIQEPERVDAMYTVSELLSTRDKRCRQSSTYNQRHASTAINGDVVGAVLRCVVTCCCCLVTWFVALDVPGWERRD